VRSYSDVGMCQTMREGRTHWLPMALAEGRERGYSAFQLWTHAHNSRAQRLYEGLQFVRPGRGDGRRFWGAHRPLHAAQTIS
jgi:ribosomal protein S18 acetylase RimI-like enzyme